MMLYINAAFLDPLCTWFLQNKRSFPWREEKTPYRILVSEVMLQQTQAERVVAYFDSFMKLFPTIKDLASSTEEQLMKAWEGLGYYSRARLLRKAAQIIESQYQGKIPCSKEELRKLPGIGPYTTGAIASFAFGQKAAAVDANVRRVMNRLIKGYFENQSESFVEQILPEKDPYIAMEALIELGAVICKKKPLCERCPIQQHCYAFSMGMIEELTEKKIVQYKKMYRTVFVVVYKDTVLVKIPSEKGIMAGLYEFYYAQSLPSRAPSEDIVAMIPGDFLEIASLRAVFQSFTNHKVTLYPYLLHARSDSFCPAGCCYMDMCEIEKLPFSSGHKKILKMVTKEAFF